MIFGPEHRRTSIFNLRSSESKIEAKIEDYALSSIFGPEYRRTHVSKLRFSRLNIEETPIFDLRPRIIDRRSGLLPPKNEEPSSSNFSAEERRTSSIFHLLGRKDGRSTTPLVLLLSPPSRSPARLSYAKVWIFRPIFHLEDRCEDRVRPSYSGHPTRRRPVLLGPAAPRRPAVRRADTNRSYYVRVLESTVSNCRGVGKCGFGAKSGPKGAFCFRRAQQGKLQRDGYRHITRSSTCIIIFGHALHEKGLRKKKALVRWSASRNEARSRSR